MRILIVSEYFHPKIMGGGETNLFLLTKALVKTGVEVDVLTSYHTGLKRKEVIDGINVLRRVSTGSSPDSILGNLKRSLVFPASLKKELQKLVSTTKYDVVHFIGTSMIVAPHFKRLNLCATIESYPALCPKGDRMYHGKKPCKIKCTPGEFIACQMKSAEIGKMKNRWYLKYNPLFLWYVYNFHTRLRKSLKYCKLIAISHYMQKLLKLHGRESEVIGNGVNIDDFNVSRNTGKLNILYLGSFTKFKGPHVLAKALVGLDIHCDFYGEGNLKGYLKHLTKNIDAKIHPFVPYEDVPKLYENADIIVFPSIWPEPFGRIAIEAMAAGKPVIGSRIGGIAETITDDVGILVEPGNIEELRSAILELTNNPQKREKMGRKGRKRVEHNYQEHVILKKLVDFYARVSQNG
jgi:glycosyltransferase involved in cell wall biosynthesis